MSKFAKSATAVVRSAVQTVSRNAPDTVTAEGGAGWSRDAKSELFLLAVANMVGETTFYEDAKSRDDRFEQLVRQVAAEDPDWVARFVPYLRGPMNMRSASLVMAAEYVRAGGPHGKAVIDSACVRADEPAELLGYWIGRYGKHLPKPVKRGLAVAARRLYNERNVLKYDGDGKTVRMADVLELAHPKPTADWQGKLFKYLIDTRHKRENISLEGLPTIASHGETAALTQEQIRALIAEADEDTLAAGGWTWEALSAKYGKLDAAFWEAMIPNMGIFALVRNLRNFDDAKIGDAAKAKVVAKLTDPTVIAKSRMFPLRFYSAYREIASVNWTAALETALDHATSNIPELSGHSLVLIDVSGSMGATLSGKSKVEMYTAAAVFGAAVARRTDRVTLVPFGSTSAEVPVRTGASALRLVEAVATIQKSGHLGYGTETFPAISKHFKPGVHNRILVFTDEQAFDSSLRAAVVDKIAAPIYTFNLAGYKAGHMPSKKDRYAFGGLSDAAFTAIELLERGKDADWPF